MNRIILMLPACLLATTSPALAQHHSHYAGMETRDIKALSQEQVDGFKSGAGMGYAMAAELNGLPGPKHVIEMAEELELTNDQRAAAQKIYDRMHVRAVALGENVVKAEAVLDSICGEGALAQEDIKTAIDDIAELNSELRFTHIVAHFEMNEVLSPQQKQTYARLRGYSSHH